MGIFIGIAKYTVVAAEGRERREGRQFINNHARVICSRFAKSIERKKKRKGKKTSPRRKVENQRRSSNSAHLKTFNVVTWNEILPELITIRCIA